MGPQEGWLKCDISEGMLPEEYTVLCNSSDGTVFSFFAPEEYINTQENLVRINVIGCQGDTCLIYIPVVPLQGNMGRSVKVPLRNVVRV